MKQINCDQLFRYKRLAEWRASKLFFFEFKYFKTEVKSGNETSRSLIFREVGKSLKTFCLDVRLLLLYHRHKVYRLPVA